MFKQKIIREIIYLWGLIYSTTEAAVQKGAPFGQLVGLKYDVFL